MIYIIKHDIIIIKYLDKYYLNKNASPFLQNDIILAINYLHFNLGKTIIISVFIQMTMKKNVHVRKKTLKKIFFPTNCLNK